MFYLPTGKSDLILLHVLKRLVFERFHFVYSSFILWKTDTIVVSKLTKPPAPSQILKSPPPRLH